ncbi:Hypothetical protein PHPALM_4827 [Phytophthora palmivora]|uniref:Uncharacterized protein n=1 Tax=Phytophthora palmivora TaxID=4796 RepID=A0A2P4YIU5_9STRA|nr:Hypothetical protein PHPALM_4827 [Phytophthora palmivora]
MSDNSAISRSDKVTAISAATPTSSGPSYVLSSPKVLNPSSPRSAQPVGGYGESNGCNTRNEGSIGLAFSMKSFRRKKHVSERLHPLEGESPRYRRHPHQQRHLSVAPTSRSWYGVTPRSPGVVNGGTSPEDSDDEVIQLKRLHAHLTSDETIDEWIRSYELERGNFASFAVFTEVKLDEVQGNYTQQAGRPNSVEAAACCATLLKMPGIVGCYKTLLEKILILQQRRYSRVV